MDGMLESYKKPGSMDEEPSEDSGELGSAASAAFPDQEWDESRLSALKDLIRLCSQSEYPEEAAEEDDGEKKGSDMLALMFGNPKKK